MIRLLAVVALLAAGTCASPARACTPAKPNARVRVSFLADSDLTALAKWAKEVTCVEYGYERALSGRRLTQSVILSVAGRDVGAIFEILLHTMNLKLYGRGTRPSIVADGPETPESRELNERERANLENAKVLANIEAEIKRRDGGHYTITRRGADAVIANLSGIAHSLRVLPERKAGKTIGFRLAGITSGSLLHHLGFRNDDVVLSLDGQALTSSEKALAAYAHFRSAGAAQASFLRGDKPLTVELTIAP